MLKQETCPGTLPSINLREVNTTREPSRTDCGLSWIVAERKQAWSLNILASFHNLPFQAGWIHSFLGYEYQQLRSLNF